MKHRDKINEMVTEVISGDAGLIIDIIGEETIEDLVEDFDDDDIRYYFERGYTGWRSVEDLIEELDAEEGGR